MPDGFLLKSVVFKLISKEISRAEHEYMNIHPPPPPPINALATALKGECLSIQKKIAWKVLKVDNMFTDYMLPIILRGGCDYLHHI